jgi:hypothetical protein
MRELRTLREGWERIEADETRLLRAMTIQASVRQWLIPQHTFEPQLQQTAALFGPERQAALAQFQDRLHRLADWQAQHGESASVHHRTSATSE